MSTTYGCLWDRDTLANEAKGVPGAIDIIAGRFERNPPLYFQMRLERVVTILKQNPSDLAAYDDAAVACDRLGDDDKAIEFMQEKARQLAVTKALDKDEHLYRYEANIGTFYIHRWIRHGADRNNMGDVSLASQHISEAIRLNPNAHFGREKYQLVVIHWIQNPPPVKKQTELPSVQFLPTFLKPPVSEGTKDDEDMQNLEWEMATSMGRGPDTLAKFGYQDAAQGLSGLIALGNAWESIDVFHALAVSLQMEGRSTVAFLARQRIEELIDDGGHSMLPQSPSGKELKESLSYLGSAIDEGRRPALRATYSSLRASAEKWQANRIAFMMERLKQGRHPDTDPDFWAGYREIPQPSLKTWHDFFNNDSYDSVRFVLWLVSSFTIPLAVIWLLRRSRAKAAKRATIQA